MEITQIIAVGLIGVILILLTTKANPDIGMYIRIVVAILIFFMIVTKLGMVLKVFQDIGQRVDINKTYIGIIFKIIGISYLSEFGMQICKDAGETAIASKIEIAGKILIMMVAVPIIITLMDTITQMLS